MALLRARDLANCSVRCVCCCCTSLKDSAIASKSMIAAGDARARLFERREPAQRNSNWKNVCAYKFLARVDLSIYRERERKNDDGGAVSSDGF